MMKLICLLLLTFTVQCLAGGGTEDNCEDDGGHGLLPGGIFALIPDLLSKLWQMLINFLSGVSGGGLFGGLLENIGGILGGTVGGLPGQSDANPVGLVADVVKTVVDLPTDVVKTVVDTATKTVGTAVKTASDVVKTATDPLVATAVKFLPGLANVVNPNLLKGLFKRGE